MVVRLLPASVAPRRPRSRRARGTGRFPGPHHPRSAHHPRGTGHSRTTARPRGPAGPCRPDASGRSHATRRPCGRGCPRTRCGLPHPGRTVRAAEDSAAARSGHTRPCHRCRAGHVRGRAHAAGPLPWCLRALAVPLFLLRPGVQPHVPASAGRGRELRLRCGPPSEVTFPRQALRAPPRPRGARRRAPDRYGTNSLQGRATQTVLPPASVGSTVSCPPDSAVRKRTMTMPRPLSC